MGRWVDYQPCITFIGAETAVAAICQITTSTLVTNWQTSFDWFWQFWSVTLVSFMVTYMELLPHILTSSASVFRFYDSFQKKELTWNHLLPLLQLNIYLWWAVASFLSSLALVNNLSPSQLSNHLSLFSQILLLISLSNRLVWVSFLSPVFVKPWQTSYNRVQHVPHLLY